MKRTKTKAKTKLRGDKTKGDWTDTLDPWIPFCTGGSERDPRSDGTCDDGTCDS